MNLKRPINIEDVILHAGEIIDDEPRKLKVEIPQQMSPIELVEWKKRNKNILLDIFSGKIAEEVFEMEEVKELNELNNIIKI